MYVSQGVYSGITVIGDADKSWRPGRGVWNQYNYHITNVADDGTIPPDAALNWLNYNNFRSGDLSPTDGQAAPDLVLGEAELCALECAGDGLVLTFALGNAGASALTAGATIAGMLGQTYAVRALTIVHGESDHVANNLGYADDLRPLRERLRATGPGADGRYRDGAGNVVEDFGLPLNLMLAVPVQLVQGGIEAALAALGTG